MIYLFMFFDYDERRHFDFKIALLFLIGFFSLKTSGLSASAIQDSERMPRQLEPLFLEAQLSLQDRDYSEALRKAEALIRSRPKQVEFLELEARVLKQLGHMDRAKEKFEKLFQELRSRNASLSQQAVYAFELGLLYLKTGDNADAQKYFRIATHSDQPELKAMAGYFLANQLYQSSRWQESEAFFWMSVRSNQAEISATSMLMISQIEIQKGELIRARKNLELAQQQFSSLQLQSNISKEERDRFEKYQEMIRKTLDSLGQGVWVPSFVVMGGYDSNALYTPNASDSIASGSQIKTARTRIEANLAYISPTMNRDSFFAYGRTSIHRNLDRDAASSEFWESSFVVQANRVLQKNNSIKLKADANSAFQNSRSQESKKDSYKLFQYSLGLTPGWIHIFSSGHSVSADLDLRRLGYPQDKFSSDNNRRTGYQEGIRIGVLSKTIHSLVTPSLGVRLEHMDAKGSEFRAVTQGMSLLNTSVINRHRWVVSLDVSRVRYYQSAVNRRDGYKAIGIKYSFDIGRGLQLLAQWDFNKNNSTEEVYTFNRHLFQAGLQWNF